MDANQYRKLQAAADFEDRRVASAQDAVTSAETKVARAAQDSAAADEALAQAKADLEAAQADADAANEALAAASDEQDPGPGNTAGVGAAAFDATVKVEEN